jgi:hypothetical protein
MKKFFLSALGIIRHSTPAQQRQQQEIATPVENEEIFDHLFAEADTSNHDIYHLGGPITIQFNNN